MKNLVSYFPGATHRRHVRKGMTHVHVLRGEAKTEGYPEYDYPFVDYDRPTDDWVDVAVEGEFFSGEDCYTDSFVRLHAIWQERYDALPEGPEKERGGALLRRLDDLPRALFFERLKELRALKREQPSTWLTNQEALTVKLASGVLGLRLDGVRPYNATWPKGTTRRIDPDVAMRASLPVLLHPKARWSRDDLGDGASGGRFVNVVA